MGIQERLLSKTRESSGSSSGNRFDFQKDWTLCHLLELHEEDRDYMLVFEHHEDVVVLFLGNTSSETADCYQIKTKQPGSWSLTNLLNRKKLNSGESLSILGKMYENIKVFGEGTTSVNFVSNAVYKLTHEDGSNCESKDCVCLGHICVTDLAKIRTQLGLEHSFDGSQSKFGPECHLRVTNLSLHDHATHAIGKLEQFLARTRPGRIYAVSTLYRTLFDEVRRRSNYEWDVSSLENLLKNKALSRVQFQTFLDSIPDAKDFEMFWTQASNQLTSEGWDFARLKPLRKACQSHEVSRMDQRNDLVRRMVLAVKDAAAKSGLQPSHTTLSSQLTAAVNMMDTDQIPGAEIFDNVARNAMVLMAIYEY